MIKNSYRIIPIFNRLIEKKSYSFYIDIKFISSRILSLISMSMTNFVIVDRFNTSAASMFLVHVIQMHQESSIGSNSCVDACLRFYHNSTIKYIRFQTIYRHVFEKRKKLINIIEIVLEELRNRYIIFSLFRNKNLIFYNLTINTSSFVIETLAMIQFNIIIRKKKIS